MSKAVEHIDKAATIKAEESFSDDYIKRTSLEQRKEEGLGIALSAWAEWSGTTLMRVFMNALEDSNFHDEADQVAEMLEKYK